MRSLLISMLLPYKCSTNGCEVFKLYYSKEIEKTKKAVTLTLIWYFSSLFIGVVFKFHLIHLNWTGLY